MNAKKARALRKLAADAASSLNLPKSGYQDVGTHGVPVQLPDGLNPDGTPKFRKAVAQVTNPIRLVKSARSLLRILKAQHYAIIR